MRMASPRPAPDAEPTLASGGRRLRSRWRPCPGPSPDRIATSPALAMEMRAARSNWDSQSLGLLQLPERRGEVTARRKSLERSRLPCATAEPEWALRLKYRRLAP